MIRKLLAILCVVLLAGVAPAQTPQLTLPQLGIDRATSPNGPWTLYLRGLNGTQVPLGSVDPLGGKFNVSLGFPAVSHVANVAAMKSPFGAPLTTTVIRDDVGAIYTDTGASCTQADGGWQIQPAIGHCWQADLRGVGPVPVDIWGSVADSNGTPGDGTDDTAAEQAAINWAVRTGRKITHPASATGLMRRVTAPLTVSGHVYIEGDYCASYRTGVGFTPGAGSFLFFDHAGQGIQFGQGAPNASEGMVFADMCLYRAQPAPPVNKADGTAGGTWTPNTADYDIVEMQDDLLLRHVMFVSSTNGVLLKSGRFRADGLEGQLFQHAITITAALDTPNIQNVHLWPFGAQNMAVINYQLQNYVALQASRADSMFISNFFSIHAKYCMEFSHDPNSGVQGMANKLHGINIDCDGFGQSAIFVDANVPAMTAQLTNFTAQGFGPGAPAGSLGNIGVDCEGVCSFAVANFRMTQTQRQGIKLNAAGDNFAGPNIVLETTWQGGSPQGAVTGVAGSIFFPIGQFATSGAASTYSGAGTIQGSALIGQGIVLPASKTPVNLPVASGLFSVSDGNNGGTGIYSLGGGAVTLLGGNPEWVANTTKPAASKISVVWNSSASAYQIINGTGVARVEYYSYAAPTRNSN